MSKVLLIVLVFLSFSMGAVRGQSDIAPLLTALDTAQGKSKLDILSKLCIATTHRKPKDCLNYCDLGLDLSRQIFEDKTEELDYVQFFFQYKSMAYNSLKQEKESLAALEQIQLIADTICAKVTGPCEANAKAYNTLGIYYFKTKVFRKAIENYKKSLAIGTALGEPCISQLMNLGMTFENAGHPDSALYFKKLGRKKLVEVKAEQPTMTKADFEIAQAYHAAKQLDSALLTINKVIDTCAKYDYALYRKAQMVGAEINADSRHYEKAWGLLQGSKSTIFESNYLEDMSLWYHLASVSTKGLGMMDSALHFKEQYVIIHDTIYARSRDESVTQAEQSVEMKSKESEIDGLTSQLGNQKNWLYFLGLLLAVVSGAFFLYSRRVKKQQVQNTYEIRYFLSGKSEIDAPIEIDPFLKKVLQTIEENLSDSNFNVEALGTEMHTSRSNLFKKIKALSGKSPLALIREMRMEKAKLLIETENFSITEVAEKVGFEDKSYFSRVFKQFFGVSPSKAA